MLEKRGDKKKEQIGGVYSSVSKISYEYILPISPKLNQATIAKTKYSTLLGAACQNCSKPV